LRVAALRDDKSATMQREGKQISQPEKHHDD
jgi:hypothetical protein